LETSKAVENKTNTKKKDLEKLESNKRCFSIPILKGLILKSVMKIYGKISSGNDVKYLSQMTI